ncbi:uncharacterized protein LOC133709140 [Rosa rugosa]|uniref:uncharacterized protein LOC133709140 n=1 Tax=Rosa rugosa TaxID=74645 RepID=UPI002B40DDD8|nr:uncharacterized protein LOC133709140 [Rosa rugosa]
MGSNEDSRKPPKRRRARMSAILPQPHMIFRFPKPEDYDHLDDDVDDHHPPLSEESDACLETSPDHNPRHENGTTTSSRPSTASYFDCNLCFKSERQPVVTVCGHLYCHSCLCDWLQFGRKCPVCEAKVVDGRIFPIYQCSGPRPKTQLV